jgi:uncharacterized membrane protein
VIESIITLLVLLFVFFLVGAITAFAAMGRANSLSHSVKSYRDIIADLTSKVATLARKISLLEKNFAPPDESKPPPELPADRPAQAAQSLGPAVEPPRPERLPETVISHNEVEVIEPVVEPPETQPKPPPIPPPTPVKLTATPAASQTTTKPAEHQTDWANLESAAGKRWLTWAGVVILFLSAAFFLEHAFSVGWIGPGVRVLLSVIVGVVLLVLGEYFLHQEMRPLGRGLIGGGVMVLYAALFAAYSPNVFEAPVIASQSLTFSLMCVVTIVAMALAIRHDAISISFLAVLGGMLTPRLVSTGADARDVLFSYILLLDLGVLGVAFYKKWRALDILAFVGTLAMFWGWFHKFGVGAPIGPPLAWLGAFWAVFAIVPVAHHLRHKTHLTIERLLMSLVNATYGFAFAYQILADRPGDLAWAAMVMSGAYLTLGALAKLRCDDAKAMFGFISLSMMFLTLFAPLRFALNGITLAWLAEAVVLAYLGFLFDYRPVRIGGFITLLLGVGRIVCVHYPVAIWTDAQTTPFANKNFWTMMCAPAASAMIAVVHQGYRRKAEPEDKQIQIICTIGASLLALLLVSFEMDQWFRAKEGLSFAYRRYLSYSSLAVLWSLGAAAFLVGMKSRMSRALRITGLWPLAGALLLIGWTFTIDRGRAHMLAINPLFGASLLACGVMWAYTLTWKNLQTKTTFAIGAGLVTLLLFSMELDRWFQTLDIAGPYLQYLHDCAIAALWGVGTLAFLAGSRCKSMARPLQATGLLPLGGAAVLIGYAFVAHAGLPQTLFVNPRFGAAAFVCVVMWIHSFSWSESQPKTGSCILSSYATLALVCAEVIPWVWRMAPQWGIDQQYTAWWASSMLLSAGAAVYLLVGKVRRVIEAYSAGLAPLAIAWMCTLQAYLLHTQGYTIMFLNPRFVGAMITLLIMLAWAMVMRTDRQMSTKPSEAIVPLYVWFTVSLLALLTTEPVGWLYRNITDPRQAAWTAQMSVTVVWGLYASAMLSIGFWRRVMPLRLAALTLYGFTAVKLLLVDMANVRQIYRIISFFVMGLLMVAASYVYHKAEKRLKKSDQAAADQ